MSDANAEYWKSNRTVIRVAVLWLLLSNICVNSAPPAEGVLPENVQRALAAISSAELKGDLSFLASDALEGRFTPSPGLEVAAEFIASKFRAAGLEPGGDQDYFQTAEMVERQTPVMMSGLTIFVGERTLGANASEIAVELAGRSMQLDHAPLLIFPSKDPAYIKGLDITGKAIAAMEGEVRGLTPSQFSEQQQRTLAFDEAVAHSGALANLTILRKKQMFAAAKLSASTLLFEEAATVERVPFLSVGNEELTSRLSEARSVVSATISIDIPATIDHKFAAKNVIGILRGSDPVLCKTAVLLTAHYDHIGTVETAASMSMHASGDSQDRIYNGANDDGSGTVSVIEIARSLGKLLPRPKRSIIFMAFFGEERGELGSQFYSRHPVFPLAQTVADLNLEQMGRTDSTEGPQVRTVTVTGLDYSDVTGFLARAGELAGVKLNRDPADSEAFFPRSDNAPLAEKGVPAHTLCVALDYPDYHALGDEWKKIDYENMAKVDRMVLLAVLNIADSLKAPQWNAKNPKTGPFRAARAATQAAH